MREDRIKALQESGKFIPWQTITISIEGRILDDHERKMHDVQKH